MRLDLLLVRLRFARSRSIAQRWIAKGHFRLDGQRVVGADTRIASGAVLTMPVANGVAVVVVDALPERRGPPAEARGCYRVLDDQGQIAIAQVDRDQRGTQAEGIAQS